jgi:hypothetical protein
MGQAVLKRPVECFPQAGSLRCRPVMDERTGEQRVRIIDTSFASENWNKAIRDRGHPGMFVRRHLEACVLTYLADELRTGDIAVTTFTYGTNLGPAQAARHIACVTAHELSTTSGQHVTIDKLNKTIADIVGAFTELDLIKVWGDGSVVAADGTQVAEPP